MRFCLFCGKEIPENAIFCPSCGGKQPQQETKSEPFVPVEDDDEDEEDNAALNLLSKVNFATTTSRKESIVPTASKKNVKKIEKVEPIQKVEHIEKKEEDKIPVNTYIPPKNNNSNEEQVKNKEELFEEQPIENIEEDVEEDTLTISEEEQEVEEYDELQRMYDELDAMEENIQPQEYVPPILSDLKEEVKKEQEEKEKTEKVIESFKPKTPPDTTHTEKKEVAQKTERTKVTYKKRNLSEEDESEDDIVNNTTMKTNSSLGFENMNDDLTADEKADLEKYKNYKAEDVSDIDEGPIQEKGEGRKSNGRKKEARKNVDREIAKRKFNIVEHEAVDKKDNVDPDYDGYYENVRPIDYDKQRDNSSLVKVILTAVAFVGLASIVFYMLITFFMQ